MKNYSENLIEEKVTIREALEKLNSLDSKAHLSLFVLNGKEQLVATLTDGDIRRALLSGRNLNDGIQDVMHTNFRHLREGESHYESIIKFRERELELIPLLNGQGRITKIIELSKIASILPIDAVVMAGGEGKRLGALTSDTPKPMLHIGAKPILEYNIDLLERFGISNINLSVNFLASKIEDYFGNGKDRDLKINYLRESKKLGTIGSVSLVEEFENDYVLVMNSDLLTNVDLEAMFLSLLDQNADMVVATIPYKVKVPYATLQIIGGEVQSLDEKPTVTYYTNAGIYIMKREILDYIPANTRFDATDLMDKVVEEKKKLISFQILGYWLDIGKPEDYEKAKVDIKSLKLH